jgi:hypothetical protein
MRVGRFGCAAALCVAVAAAAFAGRSNAAYDDIGQPPIVIRTYDVHITVSTNESYRRTPGPGELCQRVLTATATHDWTGMYKRVRLEFRRDPKLADQIILLGGSTKGRRDETVRYADNGASCGTAPCQWQTRGSRQSEFRVYFGPSRFERPRGPYLFKFGEWTGTPPQPSCNANDIASGFSFDKTVRNNVSWFRFSAWWLQGVGIEFFSRNPPKVGVKLWYPMKQLYEGKPLKIRVRDTVVVGTGEVTRGTGVATIFFDPQDGR